MKRLPLSRAKQRWRGGWRPLCALALLALLLGACEADEEGDELSGPIGPGSGSLMGMAGTVRTDDLDTPDSVTIGTISFDDGFLRRCPPGGSAADPRCLPEFFAEDALFIYVDVVEPVFPLLTIVVALITGRPETPCRFAAAILARDQGFTILASGDVTNGQGLTFHQVNLARGDTFQRFYCTELRPNVGIMIGATSLNGNKLGTVQMHFLLNSVTN